MKLPLVRCLKCLPSTLTTLSKELNKIKNPFEKGLELKGIKLMGALKEVRVQDTPLSDKVILSIVVQQEAAIADLPRLMSID